MTLSRAATASRVMGNSVKESNSERSALFYIGFALLYVKTLVAETTIVALPNVVDAAFLLASACFLVFHCIQRQNEFDRPIWFLILVGLFLIVNYRLTGLTNQMTAFLFIVAASYGVNLKRFVAIWFKVTTFVFLALVTFYLLLYVAGSDLATSVVRSDSGRDAVRLSFFFTHPNGAANLAMMLVGALLYLNAGRKLKFTHYAFAMLAALFVLYTTDSRTSTFMTISLIPLYLIYQNTGLFNRKAVRGVIAMLPLVLYGLVYLLAGPLYSFDTAPLFTGRVWLWHTTLVNSGITVFGKEFEATSGASMYGGWSATAHTLDSFYAVGLMTTGLIVSALFCWAVIRAIRFSKGSDDAFLPLLVVLLVHGFTEDGILAVAISFPMIFLSISLRQKSTDGEVSNAA